MIINCDVAKIAEAIKNELQRKQFLQKYDPYKFKWGIELQTCDKWTTDQQKKIWRDFTIAGKLLNTSPNAIYSIVKTAKPTRHLFEKTEWIGNKDRGKNVICEKGLSQFSKDDCIEAFPIIIEYLEMVINTVYQEIVKVNWSCYENINLPDYEFTGKPYY